VYDFDIHGNIAENLTQRVAVADSGNCFCGAHVFNSLNAELNPICHLLVLLEKF
jgi:hypothetical protein